MRRTCHCTDAPPQSPPEDALWRGSWRNELTSLRYGTVQSWLPCRLRRLSLERPSHAGGVRRGAIVLVATMPCAKGLFTDQRWMDLVPALFGDVGILRQAHFNVASWNAHQRDLTWGAGGQVLAAGAPLGFYHFTGLDSGNHEVALQYATNTAGIEADLVQNYREALAESERHYPYNAWSFGELADGTAVDAAWRRAYRDDAVCNCVSRPVAVF